MSKVPDFETLEEARQFLRDNWEKGTTCPCCKQRVQLYRHSINSQMARCLIDMYNTNREWVHVTRELSKSYTMYAVSGYWGLIEPRPLQEDGKKSSGQWGLTEKGKQFVRGEITVPKYSYIFNNKVYKVSTSEVNVREALGKKFNYDELIKGY